MSKTFHFKTYKSCGVIEPHKVTKLWNRYFNIVKETENYWNGITTLQWSMISYDMITNWNDYSITNIPATKCISKYELLNIIKKVFGKEIIINKNSDVVVNRCLNGTVDVSDIEKQLIELKEFYYDN